MTQSILSCSRGEAQTSIEDSAYDLVDVRDVVAGLLAAREKGRRGETYILSGEHQPSTIMHKLIPSLTGLPIKEQILPKKTAFVVANLIAFYYKLSGATPRFTPYALEVLLSNAQFSHAKATRELGYNPRPLRASFADTIQWFRDNPELVKDK